MKDEEIAPTYHSRVEQIRALRHQVDRLDANRQQRLMEEMISLVHDDPNPLIQYEALLTLGRVPNPAVLPTLQQAASDPDAELRLAACKALGQRTEVDAVMALAEIVRTDQNQDVRLAATTELGRFSNPVAIGALGSALEETDAALQYRAVESLKSATGQNYNNVASWRQYLQGEQPQETHSLVERFWPFF